MTLIKETAMFISQLFRALILFVGGLATSSVWAHTNPSLVDHQHAFFSGLLHPWTGIDHLLVMLAVGIWARFHANRIGLAPLVFVLAMAIGFQASQWSAYTPDPEFMIAMSVLVMGLLLSKTNSTSMLLIWPLLLIFGMAHGMAHGLEAGEGPQFAFMLGMLLSTSVLHLAGMVMGHMLIGVNHLKLLRRMSGWSMALFGVSLLAPFWWMAAA
jgi:urease accessory protein